MITIDRLRELEKRADLDQLKSTRIITTGFTHMANLTGVIDEGLAKGRGRALAMTYSQWADLLAAARNTLPVLLAIAEAAERMARQQQHGAYCSARIGHCLDLDKCNCGKDALDAALRALREVKL